MNQNETLTLSIQSLIKRINRRLSKLTPYSQVRWDYKEQNYYLYMEGIKYIKGEVDTDNKIYGPIYWSDLLGFATWINAWPLRERNKVKVLQLKNDVDNYEIPLRPGLKVPLQTAFEHAYFVEKAKGMPEKKVEFVAEI